MTTPTRAFRRATAEKSKVERPTVAFTLDWISDDEKDEDGNPVVLRSDTFHATMPSDERLFFVAAMAGSDDAAGTGEAAAVLEMLRDTLPQNEFRILKRRMLDPEDDVDLEMLQDVMAWLMEEWSNFPTQQRSGSSGSQAAIGAKSTGRVRGPGSTH